MHSDAKHQQLFSWRDCTGRAPSGAELQRAYRRLAKDAHPDKTGSNEKFHALDTAQKQLKSSPLQYNLRAAFIPRNGSVAHEVDDLRLEMRNSGDGLRMHLELDFRSSVERGFWKLGLLAKDVSSIEYSGDHGQGYDMCCQFLKDSKCNYKPYSELLAQHAENRDGAWDSAYASHDCPLHIGQPYTAVIDKPLHVNQDGLWAAVAELLDLNGEELACAVVAFRINQNLMVPIDEIASKLSL